MRAFHSEFATYLGPVRLVYAEDVDSLRLSGRLESIVLSGLLVVLVISGPPTVLRLSGLEDQDKLTGAELKLHVEHFLVGDHTPLEEFSLKEPIDSESKVIEANQRDSILHKITQNLYRIKDKDRRALVQRMCFRYLAGQLKSPSPTGLPSLDSVMDSELSVKFRECCLATRTKHADLTSKKFGVDRFEIGYVIRKVTTDEAILKNIEFPED